MKLHHFHFPYDLIQSNLQLRQATTGHLRVQAMTQRPSSDSLVEFELMTTGLVAQCFNQCEATPLHIARQALACHLSIFECSRWPNSPPLSSRTVVTYHTMMYWSTSLSPRPLGRFPSRVSGDYMEEDV